MQSTDEEDNYNSDEDSREDHRQQQVMNKSCRKKIIKNNRLSLIQLRNNN